MIKSQLNAIDLFCGCGGLSNGLEAAGIDIMLGVDHDEAALTTFKNNHKNSKILKADLFSKEFLKEVEDKISTSEIDLIVAGPPCQGFSLTGPRNFDDKRNQLYLSVIESIKYFHPKYFLIENVPGMAALYKGQIKDEIIKRLTSLGYNVNTKILCAADYGVPQMRKRLFFVGVKDSDESIKFPTPTHSSENYVTCGDAISDLPSRQEELGNDIDNYDSKPTTEYQKLMRGKCNILYNHVATNHTEMVKNVISFVPEGGNHKDLPPGIGESRKFNEAWTRYHSKKPSKTIDTGHRNHFHYKYNRVPTIRENARLQSFKDDFRFYGTKTQQNRQVGNAVPPLLAYNIGKKIIEFNKEFM